MSVLVACEESRAVCVAFRKLGYEAYSCDLEPCSGGHPEWHIQADALELLKLRWDIVIAFPPCTYLSNAGNRWLYHAGELNQGRYSEGMKAKDFFLKFLQATCFRYAAGVSGNPAVYVRPSVYKGNSPMASRASAAHGNRYSRSRIYMVSIQQTRQQWVCCSQWQSSVKNFFGNCAGNGRTMGAIHI